MKLRSLSEGFDFNRPGDQIRCATMRHAVDELQKIVRNVEGSRVSVTRILLRGLKRLIDGIKIESDDEREQIGRMLSLISALMEQLIDLPDGPPPEDITIYISILSHSIYDFCVHHMRRGDNAI